MKGIQHLVNNEGQKTAVLIDLEEYGDIWADFQDILVSHSRKDEAEISWETLQAEMEQDD